MESLHVLICDDESGMRRAVSRALRNYTIEAPDFDGGVALEVTEAETGEEALEQIAAGPPQILLLDHKLPGISGLDVLDQLHEQNYNMLTIMITAYASIEAAVRATKRGAYDFLPKPFPPAELRETIRKAARHFIVERQARKLAEEKRRVRFEFISVLAHELKAPINAVDGYLNILAAGTVKDKPEMETEILERCTSRISGMRKMITDLLDLTRIESGQKPRELRLVDVVEVARRALETASPDAEAADVSLRLRAPDALNMEADAGELEIILNNLVSNAVKYNRAGGHVDVVLEQQGDDIVVQVRDTGIGMAPEDARRLFRDFVRIKNDKTRNILGSGLGLSILKKLVALYDGQIDVDSEPDVGSTFTVRVPARTGDPAVS